MRLSGAMNYLRSAPIENALGVSESPPNAFNLKIETRHSSSFAAIGVLHNNLGQNAFVIVSR